MEYTVTATQTADELWQVDVTVRDAEDVILAGRTHVCVETQEEAIAYAEQVFLPDLRRNDMRLAGLVLAWEEVADDDHPDDIGDHAGETSAQ